MEHCISNPDSPFLEKLSVPPIPLLECTLFRVAVIKQLIEGSPTQDYQVIVVENCLVAITQTHLLHSRWVFFHHLKLRCRWRELRQKRQYT